MKSKTMLRMLTALVVLGVMLIACGGPNDVIDEVTVTFQVDGTDYDTKTVTKGSAIGADNFPANPTKDGGYTFVSWVDSSDAAFTADTVVNADITVTAEFSYAGAVTVTFDAAGGAIDGTATTSREIAADGTVGELPGVSNAGKTLVGWFIGDDYKTLITKDTTSAAFSGATATVKAAWVDTVSYGKQSDGSWILDPAKLEIGAEAAISGDTVSYQTSTNSGGVVNYLFPTDDANFNINDYESLTVSYFAYGWTPEGTNETMKLVTKIWDDSTEPDTTGAKNMTYPTAGKGPGSFTVEVTAATDDKDFNDLLAENVKGFGLGANAYNAEGIQVFTIKYYSIKLNKKYVAPTDDTFGPQTDGNYIINPADFVSWYGSSVDKNAGTLKFTDGGGVYYVFPNDLDVKKYRSLVVSYTTSGTAISSGHLEMIVKAIDNNFAPLSDSENYGTDLTYQWLPGANGANDQFGDGTFTIEEGAEPATHFEYFLVDGVVGMAFQAYGTDDTFDLKINSMKLISGSGVLPETVTVSFDTDGGTPATIPSINLIKGNTLSNFPADPTKAGFTFGGWYVDTDTSFTTPYTNTTVINATVALKAKWVEDVTGDTFGVQPDGSYKINPADFVEWYGAPVDTSTGTFKFAGGGVKYIFPNDLNIEDYSSLVVEYTTSGATIPAEQFLQIVVKAIDSGFGTDPNYGTDLTYPVLPGGGSNEQLGDGSFTIEGDETFAKFLVDGVVGMAFQANNSNADLKTFDLKINSMKLVN